MGIQSASATFTRFYVPEMQTGDFWSYVDEKLRAGSFRELEDDQEKGQGFASWDDFFEPDFDYGSYHKGEYVAFHFRIDQRSVPAIVKKQHVRQAVQKYREEHEGKWPSRKERQEIAEEVASWLLKRALPRPSACEVVWNPAAKWLLLGTTSSKVVEAFLEHFEGHFRIYPVPAYHAQWALNLVPLDGRQKDTLGSLVPVRSMQAMEEGRFLGYEFLTWLWFYSERSEGLVELPGDRRAEIALGERLTLCLPDEGREKVVCTTQEGALFEAREALRQGKRVAEMQLFARLGDNEYFLSMDSSLWAVKGLKTPRQQEDFDAEDADGRFLERMYFIEEVFAVLNELYGRYLAERLSPVWESETLPQLTRWIEESDGR